MSKRFTQIGFNRHLRLEWLAYAANLALAGNDIAEIRDALDDALSDKLSVGNSKGHNSRAKTVTILMKTWVKTEPELASLRDRGLELMRQLPIEQHLILHYGMIMAAYPFLKTAAENIGRLLRLQQNTTASQVQQRLREVYGERELVYRSTRYALSSFVDWGVLNRTEERGIYEAGSTRDVANDKVIAWLIEAMLWATQGGKAPLQAIMNSPAMFPFELKYMASNVIGDLAQVDVVRHGLDQELVFLRRQSDE